MDWLRTERNFSARGECCCINKSCFRCDYNVNLLAKIDEVLRTLSMQLTTVFGMGLKFVIGL